MGAEFIAYKWKDQPKRQKNNSQGKKNEEKQLLGLDSSRCIATTILEWWIISSW